MRSLELEFDRLDKKALSKYFDDLTNAEQSGVSQQAQTQLAAQLWLGLMNELLKGSPEMRVKQLGVKTANGALSGSAVLGFDGKDFTQVTSPADLMARTTILRLGGGLRRPAARLDGQGRPCPCREGAVGAGQVSRRVRRCNSSPSSSSSNSSLHWRPPVVLKPEGDKFVLRAELAGGKLMVNGNPADQLLGPMLAPPVAAPIPALAPGERERVRCGEA